MNNPRNPDQLSLDLEAVTRLAADASTPAKSPALSSPLRLAYSSENVVSIPASDIWIRKVLSSVRFF